MAYEVIVKHRFITSTKEQAEYIQKFFNDAESLMTCESSSTENFEIVETEKVS